MEILHLLLCTFLIICGLCVIFASNPVQSMIALILMFCISGVILFIFNSEFLGVTFVIIYVGAIAVLFLFIIMMLSIKKTLVSTENKKLRTFILSFFISFFVTVVYLNQHEIVSFVDKVALFKYSTDNRYISSELNDTSFDYLGNISVLGQSLFNYYSISFLLAGLVLLVALIGAVCLTLHFNTNKKSQITSKQLARSDSFLSHFRKKDN